ncbi:MAG: hypothetical protein NC094_06555 [Bacteroidales bacterium]|nr:hypothetical protein [Lachnoclostridium sp.]MCM1384794.1 hypothetical protein [Lachnoclostridium sp.]MCM1465062.1 hypothetical protein [Bacteroidales bacterium]
MDSLINYYNVPVTCDECGGVMVFVGVGEYHCENCGRVLYDDYGKVRLYIESHKGATATDVEKGTGVTQRNIMRMLKEDRIEVAEGSKVSLHCEMCGKELKSGKYCPECAVKAHRKIEETQRALLHKDMKVYGRQQEGEEGQRRFMRKH